MNKTTKTLINIMLSLINFILFSVSGTHLYYFINNKKKSEKGANNEKNKR